MHTLRCLPCRKFDSNAAILGNIGGKTNHPRNALGDCGRKGEIILSFGVTIRLEICYEMRVM